MAEANKRGSSRRKGDEYQDLTALRLALECYISRKPFQMFLEYEKAGNLDDIVLVQGQILEHIRSNMPLILSTSSGRTISQILQAQYISGNSRIAGMLCGEDTPTMS